MFGAGGVPFTDAFFGECLSNGRFVIPAGILLCTPIVRTVRKKVNTETLKCTVRGILVLAIFILSVLSVITETYNPFIYFNF